MYCVLLDASINTMLKLIYTNLVPGTHGIYTNWVQQLFWVKYKISNSDTSEIMPHSIKIYTYYCHTNASASKADSSKWALIHV